LSSLWPALAVPAVCDGPPRPLGDGTVAVVTRLVTVTAIVKVAVGADVGGGHDGVVAVEVTPSPTVVAVVALPGGAVANAGESPVDAIPRRFGDEGLEAVGGESRDGRIRGVAVGSRVVAGVDVIISVV